eukprot:3969324-Pleurochrysis_carterae.AAC.2
MHATRLCLGAVETCDETKRRWCDSPIEDGRWTDQFARQNFGDVTPCDFHPDMACYARLPFFALV